MRQWFWICFIFIASFSSAAIGIDVHPYHVGSVNIKYNKESQTFQVTAKFFLDDLEDAINLHQNTPLYFDKPKQKVLLHQALNKYVTQHMLIKSNQQPIDLQFLGYEVDSESVYFYLESKACPTPADLNFGINMLYDLYDDQMNIVHVEVGGKRKSHKLTYPDIYFTQQW